MLDARKRPARNFRGGGHYQQELITSVRFIEENAGGGPGKSGYRRGEEEDLSGLGFKLGFGGREKKLKKEHI